MSDFSLHLPCFLQTVSTAVKLVFAEPHMEHSFNCIVMDPPWENRSVKRGGKYPTVPSRQLLSLPVPNLLKQASNPFQPGDIL